MSKTTVIYHDMTQDGILCREIAQRKLPAAKYVGWHFGSPALRFPEEGDVMVLDLPLDATFGSEVPYDCGVNWGRLVWIDNDPRAIRETNMLVPGLRIAGVASSRLAWQWFSFQSDQETEIPALPPGREDFLRGNVDEPDWLRGFQETRPEAATFGEDRNMWISQGLLNQLGPSWMTYLEPDGRRVFKSMNMGRQELREPHRCRCEIQK